MDEVGLLVCRVNAEMRDRGLTQDQLSAECGISQGHLSKILKGETQAGRACVHRLRAWLDRGARNIAQELRDLALELEQAQPERRMHFMHALDGLRQLLR